MCCAVTIQQKLPPQRGRVRGNEGTVGCPDMVRYTCHFATRHSHPEKAHHPCQSEPPPAPKRLIHPLPHHHIPIATLPQPSSLLGWGQGAGKTSPSRRAKRWSRLQAFSAAPRATPP